MERENVRETRHAQTFGGPWSLVKLNALEKYLTAFAGVMKNLQFKTVYIDAFAGSGDFSFPKGEVGPLLGMAEYPNIHAGSARRALQTTPAFGKLWFIESRKKNVLSLRELISGTNRAEVIAGDSNIELVKLLDSIRWSSTRGVIFLDPFGNSLSWATLEVVAKTKLDVWYLFPLAGVYRNAPIDKDALSSDKIAAITKILGTAEWQDAFYAPSESPMLFDLPVLPKRTLNPSGIEQFVKKRLETIFAAVEPPRRLYGPTGAPLFSLFFAMANRSRQAQAVARPIARYILQQP